MVKGEGPVLAHLKCGRNPRFLEVPLKQVTKTLLSQLIFTALLSLSPLALGLSGCSQVVPQTEAPYPSEGRIEKSFFFNMDAQGNIVSPKTFACGYSFENVANGTENYQLGNVNDALHCNLEFEQTENQLIARRVTPSVENRNDWVIEFAIPIRSHFYLEKSKDSRGRETNQVIENSSRSHWSARPYMNLEFSALSFDRANSAEVGNETTFAVEDVEINQADNFLAFTKDYAGAKRRFNMLAFKHDTTFQPTPYRPENAKHMNILHVMGKKVDGINPLMYAAHWDLRKSQDIYLHGFPKEYEQIGRDTIDQWNQSFKAIGATKEDFFKVKISDRKYGFDLRYPTIQWISDKRLSAAAPLGVGMALSDVRNGKIIWGQVTIWGGMIDRYVNSYTPSSAIALSNGQARLTSGKPFVQWSLLEPSQYSKWNRSVLPQSLFQTRPFDSLKGQVNQTVNSIVMDKNRTNINATLSTSSAMVDMITRDLFNQAQSLQSFAAQAGSSTKYFNADQLQKSIGMPTLAESLGHLPFNTVSNQFMQSQGNSNFSPLVNGIVSNGQKALSGSPNVFDLERTFANVANGWNLALKSTSLDKGQAARVVIKDLLLHEVGHMIGLGHNFKENILPEAHSVPAKSSLYGGFDYAQLKANAVKNQTNYTTVMGYKSGLTDLLISYGDVKPGPMDHMVLDYLYNRVYPARATKEATDWVRVTLKTHGLIEDRSMIDGKEMRPAFFPACNDLDASFSLDPYCNRWDRGYDALTITKSYLDDYKANLVASLYAFSDLAKNQSATMAEAYLWQNGMRSFGRSRLFYDYMRQKYEGQIKELAQAPGDQGINNLLNFSQVCQDVEKSGTSTIENSATLVSLFKKYPEFHKLCVAGSVMMKEFESMVKLSGPDYIKVDYFDRSFGTPMLGGDAESNFNHVYGWEDLLGTWKELSRLPIKITALMSMTSAAPYTDFGGFAIPVMRYARMDGSFHPSTLYPKEYSSAIASAAETNLTFGNSSLDDSTYLGQTILNMGYMLSSTYFTNDGLRFSQPFIKNIRNQTAFNYSLIAVQLNKKDEEGKEIARKFSAKVINPEMQTVETVPEVYVYTNNRIIMEPPPGSLILPLTDTRWSSPDQGYYIAIKMDFADDFHDRLKSNSVRTTLANMYSKVLDACIEGEGRNGLRYFFNDSVPESTFPGFAFPKSIHVSKLDSNKFLASVEEQFQKYYSNQTQVKDASGKLVSKPRFPKAPVMSRCEEALRGQGLIVMAASAINGFYFPEILDYIQKGN